MTEYKRQHFVSRMLQARFVSREVDRPGHLARISRADPDIVELVGPKKNLQQPWFIHEQPARFEAVWAKIESAAGPALQRLDQGRPAGSSLPPKDAQAIVDLMALHLIRSSAANELWEMASRSVCRSRREAMLADGSLVEHARDLGLYTATVSDGEILDDITSRIKDDPLRRGGLWFGEILVGQFESTREQFRAMHLEVGQTVDCEFILPDAPCVPFHAATSTSGLRAGFGLNRADAIVMPLGPYYLASLVTSPPSRPWLMIDEPRAAPINRSLAEVAIEHACFRPGSGMEEMIRAVWRSQAVGTA